MAGVEEGSRSDPRASDPRASDPRASGPRPFGPRPSGARIGRPVDSTRDGLVLQVTLDLLAEHDYEHMTLDEIAVRAGRAKTTLYRRWSSKVDLVEAAVHAVGAPPEAGELPDEGSLRADLLAVVDSGWLGGPERRALIFAGLRSAARSSPRLDDAVRTTISEPYVRLYEALLLRALERGHLDPAARPRLPLLARVVPAMSDHRLHVTRQPADRAFFVSVVDEVLLPALGRPHPGDATGTQGAGSFPG